MPRPTLNRDAVAFLAQPRRLLIGGEQLAAETDETFESIDPSTGESLGRLPACGAADVDRAVRAARSAFDGGAWSKLTPEARGVLLWRLADLLEKHEDELSTLDTLDMGAPRLSTRGVVKMAVSAFRYYAGYATKIYGQATDIPSPMGDLHAYTRLEPVGAMASITPWNGPLASVSGKIAPALAAGCPVVIKPAEQSSLSALRLGELTQEAGFPPGAVNIVTGYGAVAGQALADHSGVDKVSFTGSTATGKRLITAAAGDMKRLTLELGGKSALIVFADCDLDLAIPLAARAIFANSGQACIAGSRLFVEKPIYDKVVAGVCGIAEALRLGDGFDDATELGPVVSEKQRDRVMSFIASGLEDGAELLTGGAADMGAGFFVKPTVFAATSPKMRIVREEIFGPVLAVEPFTDTDAVIAQANATSYGLAAGIVTGNVGRAHDLARRLRAGNVWINCYAALGSRLPFGGFKQSGWGRQFGWEGIQACLETKTVHAAM
jgi:phenylacetaldehyde dehydrogenase